MPYATVRRICVGFESADFDLSTLSTQRQRHFNVIPAHIKAQLLHHDIL